MTRIIDGCSLHRHRVITDDRGSLQPLEAVQDVPFVIARVYLLYSTAPAAERGFHSHRSLEQRAFCVSGSCTIIVDNGHEREEVRLDRPENGLHIGSMIWREMRDFSPDCVLMVLASEPYDEADYIRDYDQFLAEVGGKGAA